MRNDYSQNLGTGNIDNYKNKIILNDLEKEIQRRLYPEIFTKEAFEFATE